MKKNISNLLVLSLVLNAQIIKAENTENLKKEEAITTSQANNNTFSKEEIEQVMNQKMSTANNAFLQEQQAENTENTNKEEVTASQTNNNTFSKEEIEQIMNQKMNTANNAFTQKQKNTAKTLAKKLQDYKITGWSFCVDPNFAFIWDTQNPEFQVTYKNSQGETKTRNYESEINSIGLKLELDFKFDFIFFTNTEINFYDSNKEIELGSGFDLATNIVDITYVSFKNMPGGLIIVGFPLIELINTLTYPFTTEPIIEKYFETLREMGLNVEYKRPLLYPILLIMPSYVRGGHLKPIKK